jgi:tetratricopeptide (TPR) repeat protein
MEGESEYSFWHLLVRDVAYGQIPRAERTRRHRAAAAWIERKGGERVEDLAEVLAHHYLQALELANAVGDTAQAEELRPRTRHFLALAGERALGLDTVQAEARLAQALRLAPTGDPERGRLLVAWADAVAQAGRQREAAGALDEALALLRTQDDVDATAQALRIRSRVSQRLADGRTVALAAEAVELLEREPSGHALVEAYSQLSSAQWLSGLYAEAVASADRAIELAQRLSRPEPARALGYRGMAKAYLGDPGATAEMERALAMMLESGAGREAAVVQNNLGITRYPVEGVAPSIATFETGLEFCRERGLVEAERVLASSRSSILAEAGRPDDALAEAGALASAFEVTGQTTDLVETRAVQLAIKHARGERPDESEIDRLVETGRSVGHVDITPFALSCAAIALAAERPEQARELLLGLEQAGPLRETPYYTRQLPAIVRAALTIGDEPLAQRLVESLNPRYPLDEHALCAARAELAEHRGEFADAAALYGEAAARWQAFGNVPERAHALLGRGRCLLALRHGRADEPLREARELFAALDYVPAVAETDALLGQGAPAPAS